MALCDEKRAHTHSVPCCVRFPEINVVRVIGLLSFCANTSGWTTGVNLTYQITSHVCSGEDVFLTLRRMVIAECVEACRVRTKCRAVNYWLTSRQCDILGTDDMVFLLPRAQNSACWFIAKYDIKDRTQVYDVCDGCDDSTACDISAGSCHIKECRVPEVTNATVLGNILTVGSRILVICVDIPINPATSVCLSNGSWSYVSPCAPNLMTTFTTTTSTTTSSPATTTQSTTSTSTTASFTTTEPTTTTWPNTTTLSTTILPTTTLTSTTTTSTTSTTHTPSTTTTASPTTTFTTIVTTTTAAACPASWVQLQSGCYHTPGPGFESGIVDARAYCGSLSAYLVAVESEAEKTVLYDYLDTTYGSRHWWIGLTDEVTEGTWLWMHTGAPPTFTDWRTNNEGSSGTHENYVVIWNGVGWADFNGDMSALPLCEIG